MRIPLVSAFLPDVTKQIHSLRASGVIFSHIARAAGTEARDFCKSAGMLCITPVIISFLAIQLFYQIFALRSKPKKCYSFHIMNIVFVELWYLFIASLRASFFGLFLLLIFLLTEFFTVPFISRYDFIFLAAVGFQACALIFRFESPREFFVIIIFHILATGMELFKTNPAIGSWSYPSVGSAIFAIGTIPLFTGFLYSAIGSYISRAFVFLKLSYERFPAYHHIWILAALIYLNFFTHHFFYDIRYFLFLYVFIIFFKTKVHFEVYRKERSMPFLVTVFLTALFVWIAENIGTFTRVWLYPSQVEEWHFVSLNKIGSWFLLLILSFALVSIIYRNKLRRG